MYRNGVGFNHLLPSFVLQGVTWSTTAKFMQMAAATVMAAAAVERLHASRGPRRKQPELTTGTGLETADIR